VEHFIPRLPSDPALDIHWLGEVMLGQVWYLPLLQFLLRLMVVPSILGQTINVLFNDMSNVSSQQHKYASQNFVFFCLVFKVIVVFSYDI
jgi:hypothetical protein